MFILFNVSQGVGKTSLIANLALLTGHRLVRINLSEHSEIADLLGSDLPSADSSASNTPKFVWCDGIFLTAMKRGDWVLLDELNLAPQSVLEGLNACLDHRGEVFLPEIGQTIKCSPTFRVFCAQNPMVEGGGRKGLPQSFLSRFSKVFVETMTELDMQHITKLSFMKQFSAALLSKQNQLQLSEISGANSVLGKCIVLMVRFVNELQALSTNKLELFAREGSPWEFNLRDVLRWCEFIRLKITSSNGILDEVLSCATLKDSSLLQYLLSEAAFMLFISRLRSLKDRERAAVLFHSVFGFHLLANYHPAVLEVSEPAGRRLMVGIESLPVRALKDAGVDADALQGGCGKYLETLAACVVRSWPVLLIGAAGRGKRTTIRHLASMIGAELVEFSASTSTDATELLGSFEQANSYRYLYQGEHQLDIIARLLRYFDGMDASDSNANLLQMIAESKKQIQSVIAADTLKLPDGKDMFDKILHLHELLVDCGQHLQNAHGNQQPQLLNRLVSSVNILKSQMDKCFNLTFQTIHSGFEWVDGIVVNALRQGHWLVFNNVNLCSASVLDRLNSILEPNGTLLLTENGVGEVIHAHPDFRIFFTMVSYSQLICSSSSVKLCAAVQDSKLGEISRAMRNRCVEIFFPETVDTDAMIASSFSETSKQRHHVTGSAEELADTSNLLALYHDLTIRSVAANTSAHSGLLVELSEMLQEPADRVGTCGKQTPAVHNDPAYPRFKLFKRLEKLLELEKRFAHRNIAMQEALETIFPFLADIASLHNLHAAPSATSSARVVAAIMQLKQETHCSDRLIAYLFLLSTSCSQWVRLHMNSSVLRARGLVTADRAMDPVVAELAFREFCSAPNSPIIRKRLQLGLILELFQQPEVLTVGSLLEFLSANAVLEDGSVITIDEFKLLQVYAAEIMSKTAGSNRADHALYLCRLFGSVISSLERQVLAGGMNPQLYLQLHDHDAKLDIVSVGWKLFEIIVSNRLETILLEGSETNAVLSTTIWSGVPLGANQFHLALALQHEKIIANAADLRLLVLFKKYLDAVDDLFLQIGGVSFVASNESVTYGPLLVALGGIVGSSGSVLLRYRDMLSKELRTTIRGTTGRSHSELNWEQLSVILEWQFKSAKQVTDDLVQLARGFQGAAQVVTTLLTKATCVMRELQRIDNGISAYFSNSTGLVNSLTADGDNGQYTCSALRAADSPSRLLWIRAGHAAVPTKLADWQLLRQLLATSDILTGNLHAPHYLDTFGTEIDVSTLAAAFIAPSQALSSLKADFASLLATFYWSRTNESDLIDTRKAARGSADLHAIISALELKVKDVADGYFIRRIDSSEGELQTNILHYNEAEFAQSVFESANGSDPFLLLDAQMQQCAEFERLRGGDVATAAVLEPFVVSLFLQVNSSIAAVLLSKTVSIPQLVNLKSVLDRLITLQHRHSLFAGTCNRELQSILWCTEALLAVKKSGDNDTDIINRFMTTALSLKDMLECRGQEIMVRGLLSSFSYLSTQFGSQTLYELLTAKSINSVKLKRTLRKVDFSESSFTGSLRLMQATGLEMALKHLDIAAAVPSVLQHGANSKLSLLGSLWASSKSGSLPPRSSASLFISETNTARHKLLQLCRSYSLSGQHLSDAEDPARSASVATVERLGRINSLLLQTVDLLGVVPSCCSIEAQSNVQIAVETLVAAISRLVDAQSTKADMTQAVSNCKSLAQGVINCDIAQLIADSRLSRVFTLYFNRLLVVLTSDSLYYDVAGQRSDFLLLVGRAWVLSSVLRISVLLPVLPIDPAVAPAIKARLLSDCVDAKLVDVKAEQCVSLMSGGPLITNAVQSNLTAVISLQHKIEKLNSFAIERPANASPFVDLFVDLYSAHDSFCQFGALERFIGTDSFKSDELQSLLREEIVWQEAVAAYLKKIESCYAAYVDITSPFVASIHNLSFGVRTVVGYYLANQQNDNRSPTQTGGSLSSWWGELAQFPVSAGVQVDSSVSVQASAAESVRNTVRLSHFAVNRVCEWIASAKGNGATLAGGYQIDCTLDDALVQNLGPHLSMLCSLSKLEYFIGGGTLRLAAEHLNLFNDVLGQFVQLHLRREAERVQKEAENAAFYQRKGKAEEKIYETNEEKEEDEALRLHFPDHLGELTTMLDAVREGQEDYGEVSMDTDEDHGDSKSSAAQEQSNALSLDSYTDDFHSICSLIGLHSRMVFIHMRRELECQGLVWSRKSHTSKPLDDRVATPQISNKTKHKDRMLPTASDDKEDSLRRRSVDGSKEYFYRTLMDSSMLAAKALFKSASNLFSPSLDSRVRGGCIMMLFSVADKANTTADVNAPGRRRPDVKMLLPTKSVGDRDLLFLLDPLNRTSIGAISGGDAGADDEPLDFHAAPNPAEAVLACDPLKAIFARSCELLATFPNNEFLLQVCKLSARINYFHISTPIGKVSWNWLHS
jgi:MoxR-like ATPase